LKKKQFVFLDGPAQVKPKLILFEDGPPAAGLVPEKLLAFTHHCVTTPIGTMKSFVPDLVITSTLAPAFRRMKRRIDWSEP